jgi:D-alanine-D-alanine ligase
MVLFGGRSAEHDVSRATAVTVTRSLDPAKYDVIPVAITTDGQWLLSHDAQSLLASSAPLPAAFAVSGTPIVPPTDPVRNNVVGVGDSSSFGVDVVLPLLHGPYGEDGTVQGLLELAGLPYVGCGVLASALCMDKRMMKQALRAAGLTVAADVVHRDGHDIDVTIALVEKSFGFPCFVKPANMGSSVGVSKAKTVKELRAAIEHAVQYDEWVLVEEAIVGREIEVAILGDDPPEASLPGEVVPGAEFYSYADKYESDAAQLFAPAQLEPREIVRCQELARDAFAACACEAMARVDFFYETSAAGRGFIVNELNTIPGFTSISMYPKLWEASGLAYGALLDRLIELAIARYRRRELRAGRQR